MNTDPVPLGGEPRMLPLARHRTRQALPAAINPPAPLPPAQRDAARPEYDVGYGKPPKHTQFQKGRSGNPRGRPRNAKGLSTIVRERMTEKVEVRTASGTSKVTRMDALVMRSIELALKGNVRMAAWLASQYAAAVPDAPANADTSGSEDLTATDLAMLEALELSFAPMVAAASAQPAEPFYAEPADRSLSAPCAKMDRSELDDRPAMQSPAVDDCGDDWDRTL